MLCIDFLLVFFLNTLSSGQLADNTPLSKRSNSPRQKNYSFEKIAQSQKTTPPILSDSNSNKILGPPGVSSTRSITHPIRISGVFEGTNQPTTQLLFNIAALYYSKVLIVVNLPAQDTRFRGKFNSTNPCFQLVPDYYVVNGFDQNKTDAVIFVLSSYDPSNGGFAISEQCQMARRPVYGMLAVNTYYYLENYQTYHKNIRSIVHQLTHFLGFSESYFDKFYISPRSNIKRNKENVVQTTQDGRNYIVTPTVKDYVQRYFSCYDQTIGALLEDGGSNQTKNSHWESLVYRDELMIQSTLDQGSRITRLTLSLLQDTGFYQSVDLSMSEPTEFGAGMGCDFARGKVSSFRNNCDNTTKVNCDFYGSYQTRCQKQNYTNNMYGDVPFYNRICSNASNQKVPPSPSNRFEMFGTQSKCIMVNSIAGCFKTQCNSNSTNIKIIIGNRWFLCRRPDQVIQYGSNTIKCPKNFKAFCLYKNCPNWCSRNGICLNGRCICLWPWTGVSCSNRIQQLNIPTSPRFISRQNI